ncbi:MAG: phosphoribosylanthranilate isomerase [Ardenticatenaceae bacterium]|nr:phosphoribosylanthranilate isomerase [Ardenticatenaceae bacterium]
MKVKICGLTNLEDAQTAVAAGADYLGFIFYPPSKRAVEVDVARRIVAALRAAPHCPLLVGVFVNETAPTMAKILDDCWLDFAQLSGEEVPALIGEKSSPIYGRAYKALRPASLAEAEADAEWYLPPEYEARFDHDASDKLPPSLLIDTYHPTLRGGTGETGDWGATAVLARKVPGLMLAGGLTVNNVAQAVRFVRPFAVDVASGVESAPGRKDPALVGEFIRLAKMMHAEP